MTITYTRGTKTVRVKTARITPGDQLLTERATHWKRDADGSHVYTEPDSKTGLRSMVLEEDSDPLAVQGAQTKTGAVIRTVDHITPTWDSRRTYGRRNQRQYTVYFTDGTYAAGNAPIYTWHAVSKEA